MLQIIDLFGTLFSHNVAYTECACKAANIEVKFPFIDKDIIKYCLNLPDKYKIDGGKYKVILRDSMINILPREILGRKAAGFSMPIRYWFSHCIDNALEILKSTNTQIRLQANTL